MYLSGNGAKCCEAVKDAGASSGRIVLVEHLPRPSAACGNLTRGDMSHFQDYAQRF